MQARKITLIDIGAGALPSVTPVTARNASWFPTIFAASTTPPVEGVIPAPVADGVLIEWEAVDQAGVIYIIERGPAPAGPWTEIHRTTETRYLYSDGSGQKWYFRITASVRGKPGAGTVVEATPPPTTAQLVAQQQKLDKEITDRIVADAAEANARVTGLAKAAADLVLEAQARAAAVSQAMDAVASESQARATALLNEKLERKADITAESEARQSDVESLARALSEVAAGSGTQFDSAKIWHFNTAVEGWSSNGGAATIVDGWLRPFNSSNAYITSPTPLAIDGAAYRFIKVRLRKEGAPVWKGTVWWTTDADTTFTAAKSITTPDPSYDANGIATLDLDNIPWNGASPIRQIRLDLTVAQTVSAYLLYDYIAVGRPAPGASVALVQEETQARITAMAAEASQRNTLAVQMRGSYTGSDLAQVTQGFVADERVARVAADSAQVQRLSNMEVRMPAGAGQLATTASVTQLQEAMFAADSANSQAVTAVSSKLSGLRNLGDNRIINSSFATDFQWWVTGGTGGGNTILRVADGGDGGPGVVITRALAGANPYMDANEGQYFPAAAGTVLRARIRMKRLSGSGNVLARIYHRNEQGTQFQIDRNISATAEWTNIEVDFGALPAGSMQAAFRLYVHPAIGTVSFDRIELFDVTDAVANATTASGLQALSTRTTIIEGVQSSQATLIGQVQTGLNDKVSNTTFQTLDSKVTQQGNTLNSQGQAITAVNLRADGLQSGLNSIGGDNLLGNSSFEVEATSASAVPGWINNSGGLGSGVTRRLWADSTLPSSTRAWRWELDNVPAAGYLETVSSSALKVIKVEAGKPHILSAYVRGSDSARVFLQFRWTDAAGAVISYSGTPAATQYRAGPEWARVSWMGTAPANAVSCVVYLRVYGANVAGQWVEWDNVQVQIGSTATGYAPSVEEAAATLNANVALANTLNGKVTTLEGTTTVQGQAITTVTAGLAQANRSGSNMMIDGSFEGRPVGTALSSWAIVTANGRTGANALTVTGDGVARSTALQTFDVTPGRTYYAEGWVKRVGAATTGTIQLRASLSLNGASATFPAFQSFNAGTVPTDSFVKVGGNMTIPEGKNQLIFQTYHNASMVAGQQMIWDDFVLLDVTEAQAAKAVADATAGGLQSLTGTVIQQGGQISAQATQLNQVQAAVAGKADASAYLQLEAKVNANLSGAGNMLAATTFADAVPNVTTPGWAFEANTSNAQNVSGYVQTDVDAGVPTGMRALILTKSGTANGNGNVIWRNTASIPVTPGKSYIASVYASGYAGVPFLWVTGPGMEVVSPRSQASGGNTLAAYDRIFVKFTPPAGCRAVALRLALAPAAGNGTDFGRFVRPMLEEVQPSQDAPSPWSAGGQESFASVGFFTDVNGNIGGIQNKNNGTTSEINMLANVLNILSPGAADGLEIQKGYLRVWRGNSQRIIGNGFGVGGEGLIDYFGPNVGAAAASKLNATMWMDYSGNAYWGGAISAGVRRNAVQSTTTVTVGTQLVNGPFDTNGANKNVVVGFTRNHRRQKGQYGTQGFVAGAGSNSCTVNVYRRIENDPEMFWTSFTAGGGIDISNETDGPDIATSYWSGSVTLNDGADGSRQRTYRAEIVGFSEQAVTHQSGSFDSQSITQSLSIVSIEA